MPSVSKAQATLMAMGAHNPALAKKKGVPQKVARDFNRADKRAGVLRKAQGGRTPMQSGADGHQNFGQGRGNSMFSTMPLMGHAMSGTQLGQADALIRKSQMRFADGGSVKKSASAKPQMSAKERREVRDLIERGKSDAVSSLREARAMLLEKAPRPAEDVDSSLARLSQRLEAKGSAEYQKLMAALESGGDPKQMMQIVDQLAALRQRGAA